MRERKVILVHGRHFKPDSETLLESWSAALRHGVSRDYGEECAETLDGVDKKMAYFGDVSNAFLRSIGKSYDGRADQDDRKVCLAALVELSAEAFDDKDTYEALPGKTALKEALADVLARPLELFGVADNIIGRVAPDIEEYWEPDSQFGSDVRWPLTELLKEALLADQQVLLISHSLGTLIAYDVLWKFSHYREYREILARKTVDTWVTLGSPLGNPTVKNKLKGADAEGKRRYPHTILRWINVAAEDDYISHDQTVADDYRRMLKQRLLESIVDHRIFNLSVRDRKSNPHHGAGYLIHPSVAKIVADWLS